MGLFRRKDKQTEGEQSPAGPDSWRLLYNPEGDAADILAYGTALVEGRIAGKYMLSNERLPNTISINGVRRKGIIAGADVRVDEAAAQREEVDVAKQPRSGRAGANPVGTITLSELMTASSDKFTAVPRESKDPAVLLYTSGTTGKPKGVRLSHGNFYSQCSQIVPAVLGLVPEDRVVLVLPLFHVYGLSNGLVSGVYNATSMVLVPHYSPGNLLSAIEENEATVLIAIPSMYQHLLQYARVRKVGIPKSLRSCISGGAPLAVETIRQFEDLFETRISEGYGLTETTSAVCLNRSGESYKEGSIGPPAAGVEMKVVDEDGKDVPDGEVGEIIIAGDVVTAGYWNDEASTAESLIDGWLHTGDLGYRDSDGYFFITDRKKDLIIRGGYNISPREIEEVLVTHPAVEEAAVISVSDKREREAVKAFVVLSEGASETERSILDYCVSNLASYKVPKYVEFRPHLPKSMTGKILRRELRELLTADAATPAGAAAPVEDQGGSDG